MNDLKIEWVPEAFLGSEPYIVELDEDPNAYPAHISVVRLDAVDDLIEEAVWAMEMVRSMWDTYKGHQDYVRAQAFLASPLVAAWQARQKQKAQP